MQLTQLQQNILLVIANRRKSNPITGKQIASAVHMRPRVSRKEGADVRSVINALRTKGFPICASGDGYWYAHTEKELEDMISEFEGRIAKQQEACAGLKTARERIGVDPSTFLDTPLDLPRAWDCPRCQTHNSAYSEKCITCFLARPPVTEKVEPKSNAQEPLAKLF